MTVSIPSLLTAQAEATVARARFFDTLDDVRDRLAPKTIARNAWDGVREKGEAVAEQTVEFAITQPRAAGAIAAGLAAFVIRKPIGRAVRAVFRRRPKAKDLPSPSPDTVGAIAARAGDES